MEFDGSEITSVEAKLPAFTIEMPEGYKRGTHLRMEIEFRVRSVRYEEDRKGNLMHQMVLAVEEVELKKVISSHDENVTLGLAEDEEIEGQTSIDEAFNGSVDNVTEIAAAVAVNEDVYVDETVGF